MDFQEFSPPIKYGATIGQALSQTVAGDVTFNASTGTATFAQGVTFLATSAIGFANLGTSTYANVTLLADSLVLGSRKVYPFGFVADNKTTWVSVAADAPTFYITDGSGGTFFSFGTVVCVQNAVLSTGLGGTGALSSGTVSFGSAYIRGTGGATNKGLTVTTDSSGTFSAGGTLFVSVWGIIK